MAKAKAKAFKVHKMYKGKIIKTANTMAQHNALKKLGYNHTKPSAKKDGPLKKTTEKPNLKARAARAIDEGRQRKADRLLRKAGSGTTRKEDRARRKQDKQESKSVKNKPKN